MDASRPRPAPKFRQRIFLNADQQDAPVGIRVAGRTELKTPVAGEVFVAGKRATRFKEGEERRAREGSEEGIEPLAAPLLPGGGGRILVHGREIRSPVDRRGQARSPKINGKRPRLPPVPFAEHDARSGFLSNSFP